MRRVSFVACCAVLAACSNSTTATNGAGAGSGFASQMCAKIATCASAPSDCQAAFAAWVLSDGCQQVLLSASCADLVANPTPQSLASCIPACTGTMTCTGAGSASVTAASCNGDGTVTECIDGNQYTYSCEGICAAEQKAYAGTCAQTYQGQPSPSGCAACWCQ